MSKKILFVNFLILFGVFLMLSGCSQKGNNFQELLDEASINNQMNKWVEAWEIKNTDYFYDTMASDGIDFKLIDGFEVIREELTINDFKDNVTDGETGTLWEIITNLWYLGRESDITVDNINVLNEKAVLSGKWIIFLYESYGCQFPVEFEFKKRKDTWVISKIDLGNKSEYYDKTETGVENEPFDPDRHNAYVSFKADGELYVFHDKYAAHFFQMSGIDAENNQIEINVDNLETNELFSLRFYWKGDNAGQFKSVRWEPNLNTYLYNNMQSNFTLNMEEYNLEEGLIKGSFSGYINTSGEDSVHLTEGFFYINHELNIPSVNINSPINEQMLSGDIIISGSVSDDSDILDVFISLINSDGYLKSEKHLGNKKNWSLSLDTTKYPNGDYTIEVTAVDEYGNRSYKESINVDIVN